MNIRDHFSISDLENFSGIKAHTLRVWEKRYGLLKPERSEGNQRVYPLEELIRLLNIKVLYDNGHKISKIGGYRDEEMTQMVKALFCEDNGVSSAVDNFKIAMLNFDQSLFERTYRQLLDEKSFRQIFTEAFIPLLEQIGYLWQANSISPAHEHFISNLIQQKVMASIERIQIVQPDSVSRVFALYLPKHEIHDLGLLFLHYELILRGYKSIYLGQSVPLSSLEDIKSNFEQVTFVSYFTVFPNSDDLPDYVAQVKENLLDRDGDAFWLCGRKSAEIKSTAKSNHFLTFVGVHEVLGHLEEITL